MRQQTFTILAALLLTGCPHQDREAAKVSGQIHDYLHDTPIQSAVIRAFAGKQLLGQAVSDSKGSFEVTGLPADVTLDVYAQGHQELTRQLVLAPGENRGIDLFMAPPGYQLPYETILFVRGGHIWKVDPAGLHPVDLTADLEGTQDSPAWNGDRTQFAFVNRIPGRTKIFTRNADGTAGRFLADVPDSASELAWCRDDRQLIFTRAVNSADLGTTTDLEWFDAFSGDRHDLIGGAQEADPAWSPDGREIAWSRHFPSRPSEVWLAQPTGGDQHPFLSRFNAIQPAWSPDGQRLVFSSNREGQWDLYEAALEDPDPRKLTAMPPDGYARHPRYSPLGDEILFQSNVHDGIAGAVPGLFSLNLRTREIHEILDDASSPVW